jgi:hypothetical protein
VHPAVFPLPASGRWTPLPVALTQARFEKVARSGKLKSHSTAVCRLSVLLSRACKTRGVARKCLRAILAMACILAAANGGV